MEKKRLEATEERKQYIVIITKFFVMRLLSLEGVLFWRRESSIALTFSANYSCSMQKKTRTIKHLWIREAPDILIRQG